MYRLSSCIVVYLSKTCSFHDTRSLLAASDIEGVQLLVELLSPLFYPVLNTKFIFLAKSPRHCDMAKRHTSKYKSSTECQPFISYIAEGTLSPLPY